MGVRTLRGRVSLVATATIAAWLIVLAVALNLVVGHRLDRQIDSTLKVRAQAVSTVVEIADGALVGVAESATDSELDSGIWVFAGTRVVAAPRTTGPASHTAAELALTPGGFTSRYDRRFYVLPITDDGRRIGAVVAALDTDPYVQTQRLVALASTAVALLLLAGAYPILRIAAKRSLRPTTAMSEQAARWSVHAPTQRFGSGQRFAELRELAGSLDELLDRVSALTRHERQLNAELSHELRTPLTRMIAETELALAGHQPADAALRAVRDDCADMNATIETLLATARVETSCVVAHTELDELLSRFATDPSATPAVEIAETGLSVGIADDIVRRILNPIVENARRYATSSVRIDAVRSQQCVVVRIANDGPMIAPDDVAHIFEPGFRGADQGGAHSGVGLGLALAQRLALAVDGHIAVTSRPDWTVFAVQLPTG